MSEDATEEVYLRYGPNSPARMLYLKYKPVSRFPVRVLGTLARSAWVPVLSVAGDWSKTVCSTKVLGRFHQPVWAWRLDHYDHPIWNWEDTYAHQRHHHTALGAWIRTVGYELRSDYICSKPSKVLKWPIGCRVLRGGREYEYRGYTGDWQLVAGRQE